jgi:pilus assembly protein CpaF
MLNIAVTTPKGQRTEEECTIDSCTIGKNDDNRIMLQGWSVGRKHATIHRRGDGVFVEDHGSSSGTSINDKKFNGVHGPLQVGDQIGICDYVIMVLDIEAPEPAVVAPETVTAVAVEPENSDSAGSNQANSAEVLAVLKSVHNQLIKQMDLRRVDVNRQSEEELRENTRLMLNEIVAADKTIPAHLDGAMLAKRVLDEVVGLGPLEDLLADDSVSEIMVNSFDEIFIERNGKLIKSDITFTSNQAVLGAIERIVTPIGRRIDESSPMVDARLKDGSRVNAVIPPLALKGANITIRKFSKKKLVGEDLVKFGSMTPVMLEFLKTIVVEKANIIISGGTGSGKTTLLNVMSNYIPNDERIVTVEDAAELQLGQANLIGLESRPANAEGKGLVSIRELVKNCLRMRPDRIVVGECRGGEALDMLTAMNTGHDGSLTTAHANTPRDCLARIEVMVMMAGMDLPIRAIREQIASAIKFIVQQNRFSCGTRKITHITEVTGMEGDIIQLQDIYLYKREGFGADGKVRGRHIATGQIPEFYEELASRGMQIDLSIFDSEDKRR